MAITAKPAAKNQQAGKAETKAADGEKKARVKKERVKRTQWGTRDADGKLTTLIPEGTKTFPEGYDPKTHLPLRKGDFQNPSDYLELTATRLEEKAKRLRKQADEERSLGSVADRKKARRFKGLAAKFKELEAEFKKSGMSEDQIAAMLAD